MMTEQALLEKLEKEYPDTLDAIVGMSEEERIGYMAKRELIKYIKLIMEG